MRFALGHLPHTPALASGSLGPWAPGPLGPGGPWALGDLGALGAKGPWTQPGPRGGPPHGEHWDPLGPRPHISIFIRCFFKHKERWTIKRWTVKRPWATPTDQTTLISTNSPSANKQWGGAGASLACRPFQKDRIICVRGSFLNAGGGPCVN